MGVTLPVWIAGWEIGCCGEDHVATVGSRWSEVAYLSVDDWNPAQLEDLGWSEVSEGKVRFVARTRPADLSRPESGSLLNLGTFTLFAPESMAEGVIVGVGEVWADWHEVHGGNPADASRMEGIIRRVSCRQQVLEQIGERTFAVIGHDASWEVPSTQDVPSTMPETDVLLALELIAS